MDLIDNRRSFLIPYSKEYIEYTKVVFYIIDLFIFAVRVGSYFNKIDLHPFKEAYNNNKFKRAFIRVDVVI